jgi:alpha-tubulin suppressor-like RCC1 family protein
VTQSSGEVKCWGTGGAGALGTGATADQYAPVAATALAGLNVTQVSTTVNYSCAVLADGTARCWGYGGGGVLGNGATTSSLTPVVVSGLTNVRSISANTNVACALLTSGTVKCWGTNYRGNLGIGVSDSLAHTVPETVLGISTATRLSQSQVVFGSPSFCAVLADTTVKCWGNGSGGVLGNGSTADQSTPVAVTGLSGATDVTLGGNHACALLSGGTVKCWGGSNSNGQLGNGTNTTSLTPVLVSGLTGVTEVSAGYNHTCARLTSGEVKCWGYGSNGGLGNGSTANSNVPVTVSGITTATGVRASVAGAMAILADGTLKSWGYNGSSGLLGIGTTDSAAHTTPVVVNGNWGNQPGFPAAITITVTDTSGSTPTSFSLTNS